jgi:ribosome biogenesis GTPase / thiamine phosphate phosphatase
MSTIDQTLDDPAVVLKKTLAGCTVVLHAGETLECTLAGSLRHNPPASRPARRGDPSPAGQPGPLAVGDRVRLRLTGPHTGQITEILPRRNRLARRSPLPMPGAHAHEQVIAANVDLLVPVMAAAAPSPRWNLLDRFLVSAESLEIPCLVVITKADLARHPGEELDPTLQAEAELYRRIGYPVLLTSAASGAGLEELRQALFGQVAAFIGKSGVGKTSLLNALQPGLGQRVNAVNPITGKGRHTTTATELHRLPGGGGLVDTPGIREFGLWGVDEADLALYFPEMRPYVGRCRFGLDCRHADEPGCALRRAVVAGQVSPRRYQSYMKLNEEGYFE